MSSLATKRMALSREQRSVLEAVYAIEKLPDAGLRDRLSKYLDLSTRQIQVWFQNRRQRQKANGGIPSPKRPVMYTPSQIMDALFDFSGNSSNLERLVANSASADGTDSSTEGGVTSENEGGSTAGHGPMSMLTVGRTDSFSEDAESPPVSDGAASPPATTTYLDVESFDWGLPASLPNIGAGVDLCSAQAPVPVVSGGVRRAKSSGSINRGGVSLKRAKPDAKVGVPGALWTPSCILEAILGFACQEMHLEAAELWPLPLPGVAANEPIFTHRIPSCQQSDKAREELACSRAMLASQLCESAARAHELAWYVISEDQREALARTGVTLRTLVGVPCLEPPSGSAPRMGMPTPVCGVLILYSRQALPQTEAFGMLLHAVGSAAAAAYALGLGLPKTTRASEPLSYTSIPAKSPAESLSWLLLAATRTLQADAAEHWTARQLPATCGGGVYMAAEQILASKLACSLPDIILEIGADAEVHHPFSSHMSRASLYAGKLVWCNGSGPSGTLDCLKTPMQTAIGLPLRSHTGGGATFVFYSMRRLEQSPAITFFLAQLQVLAAASQVAAPAAEPERTSAQGSTEMPIMAAAGSSDGGGDVMSDSIAPQLQAAPEEAPGVTLVPDRAFAVSPLPAPTATMLPGMADTRGGAEPDWRPQEPVMSTDQVLSLIECLGDGARGLSRNVSATALLSMEPCGEVDDILAAS
mmetsp:Transcript_11709/g.30022  ORF Transcript_11709/g.30022 Transcript_11709/m.30022 type:complete len:701 (+) Transcript_11709:86-2188(+)|eukprot:CAMPEP_0115852110 /NCGR_PEP_ID=MMETSP0287-20121206/12826_1 /TAXON_ID=412157 /ORGANISM="Chrysochromulina rotalis, Strain UIO044" /LENGTH=700 /DNA_ID=CAMNT_0003306159 /DNA_START=84 /DNA_END=2186 /DNA_ORIENTATION=-